MTTVPSNNVDPLNAPTTSAVDPSENSKITLLPTATDARKYIPAFPVTPDCPVAPVFPVGPTGPIGPTDPGLPATLIFEIELLLIMCTFLR